MNNAVFEMIYGRPENYRAKAAVKADELIQLGTRAALLPTPKGSKFVGVALNG